MEREEILGRIKKVKSGKSYGVILGVYRKDAEGLGNLKEDSVNPGEGENWKAPGTDLL